MKIGDSVYIHGYVDEIRKGTVIIRNKGGYFGTDPDEITADLGRVIGKWTKHPGSDLLYCSECGLPSLHDWAFCEQCGADMRGG